MMTQEKFCLLDRYNLAQLEEHLQSSNFGAVFEYRESITSTNDRLLDMAECGAPEGSICLADQQTAGRGRRGSRWFSPSGGIWTSFLLRPRLAPTQIPPLTLCAANAIIMALKEVCKLDVEIKWPNDILIQNRKVAGILTESRQGSKDRPIVVVGMGINVNYPQKLFPPQITDSATSLEVELGHQVSRQNLFLALVQFFESGYKEYLKLGPEPLISKIDSKLAWKRQLISVEKSPGFVGRISHLAKDGGLVVKSKNSEPIIIYSGSIKLALER
tara:strand:+ start:52805 stop:53623 length:819 start_codon:yes stop_codon:yes gene_type:complete